MQKKKKKPTQVPFAEKVANLIKKEQKMYEDAVVKRSPVISFPRSKKPPFWGKVGVFLVKHSGGIMDMRYTDPNVMK